MKKRILIITAAVLVLLAIALAAFAAYRATHRPITVVSGKQYVDECPGYARPGQEVTVTTVVVTDAEIYVNGVDGTYTRPGVYQFIMPDEDVELKVTVISYKDGA